MNSDQETFSFDRAKEKYKNLPVSEKKKVINEVITHLNDFLVNGDLSLGGHSDKESTMHLGISAIEYHKSLLDKLE